MEMEKKQRKLLLPGLLFVLAAAALVLGAAAAIRRTGFESVYLYDTESVSYGWKYEIRTASGGVKEVFPQYINEYDHVLAAEEDYDALKMSRIMEEALEYASLNISYTLGSIEVFLDGVLIYSDFQTAERDVNGYLLTEGAGMWEDDRERMIRFSEGWREITVSLPEDYRGKRLEVYQYFPETAEDKGEPGIILQDPNDITATVVTGSMPSTLWMIYMGCTLLVVAVFGAVSLYYGQVDPRWIVLFLLNALMFCASVYKSDMGFYSGLRGQVDEMFGRILPSGIDVLMLEGIALIFGVTILLVVTRWDGRKKQQKIPWSCICICSLAAFLITALQQSSETGGGLSGVWAAVRCMEAHNFRPAMLLCSYTIYYAVTFIVIVQFIQWRLREWRKKSLFMERSRFAVKNHELIMMVDEDSRRRKHEMKHHMETLYALMSAGEMEQAKSYVAKMIKDTELSSEVTYSTNVVLNSIVGFRLNQAKKNGITVQCHIHVPDRLSVDEVDLNILLSNMLENALEACMRMEDRQEAYIGLQIRKRQNFLYIECTNSVAPKERLDEQRKTIKEDLKDHGFGLDAMGTVAEKYASIIQTERTVDGFIVRTNLCLAE